MSDGIFHLPGNSYELQSIDQEDHFQTKSSARHHTPYAWKRLRKNFDISRCFHYTSNLTFARRQDDQKNHLNQKAPHAVFIKPEQNTP